jgi:hypothetical protein
VVGLNGFTTDIIPGGDIMDLLAGIALIAGMMLLIFLGPEWILGLARGVQDFKDSRLPR